MRLGDVKLTSPTATPTKPSSKSPSYTGRRVLKAFALGGFLGNETKKKRGRKHGKR